MKKHLERKIERNGQKPIYQKVIGYTIKVFQSFHAES